MVSQIIPPDFGNVEFQSNSNLQVNGERNSGYVVSNSNLLLASINSVLSLLGNSNGNLNIQNSRLKATATSNSHITGNNNTLEVDKEANIAFNGNDNQAKFTANSNTSFAGNNGNVEIQGNSFTALRGDNNLVVAKGNSWLSVSGDHNDLTICGTIHHEIKPAQDTNGGNILKLTPVWKGPNQSRCSIMYSVQYLKNAAIEGGNYKLGIFKFAALQRPTEVSLFLKDSDYDPNALQVTPGLPGEVQIAGSVGGQIQTLQVLGPEITIQTSEGTTTLLVKMINSTGI